MHIYRLLSMALGRPLAAQRSSRSARVRLLWGLLLACAMLALPAASAQAVITHEYLRQITEIPAEGPHKEAVPFPGPLGEEGAMTIDSGDLYITEHFFLAGEAHYRVDELDAHSDALVSQFGQVPSLEDLGDGVAVGHAIPGGQVYVGAVERVAGEPEGVVAVFDGSGNPLATWKGTDTEHGSFGQRGVAGVAVDSSASLSDWARGDVYVADHTQGTVEVFEPQPDGGERLIAQLTGPGGVPFVIPEGTGSGTGVAVDQSTGDVLVVDHEAAVDVFEPVPGMPGLYRFLHAIASTPAGPLERVSAVAVDAGNGELYVSEGELGIVNQFGSEGAYLGRLTATPAGPIAGLKSVAIDPGSHDVYVGVPGAVDVFGGDLVLPDVTTGPVSALTPRSATLTGTVNPNKAGKARCQFEWGQSPSFGNTAPCSAEVGEGGAPVGVHAEIAGLQSDTTYDYRLQASNANGSNPGEAGETQQFTTSGPGLIRESASAVTAESATLEATIDPHNAPTSFYFQYGTDSAYGANAPVPPGSSLGAGGSDVDARVHLQGLQAGTVYHYRVVAFSETTPGHLEEFDGADQTLTTQAASATADLLDGRQWELVSPADKHGALFLPIGEGVIKAAAQGNAIAELASQPSEAEPQGYSNYVSVLSTRGVDGWSSQVIAPPHAHGTAVSVNLGQELRFFSEDLSRSIVEPFGNFLPLSPEATGSTPYLRSDYLNGKVNERCETSCYQPLVTAANTPPGTPFGDDFNIKENGECDLLCGPEFIAGSPDLSRVFLESPIPLISGAEGPYEWAAGKLRAVAVPIGAGGATEPTHVVAFSDDGSRAVLATGTHLYVRDLASGAVARVDAPQGGPATGAVRPQYEAASNDGSRIFFEDSEQLTSATGGGLYECQLAITAGNATCQLTLLPEVGAEAGQVLGASSDGSYVYVAGSHVVYVDHFDGATWSASATPMPASSGGSSITELKGQLRVSENGEWLAFMSKLSLTGYDNRDANSGQADEEVYLYNAGSNNLSCVSCNPTGARPVGVEYRERLVSDAYEFWPEDTWIAANIPQRTQWDISAQLPRFLSDSGRVFFDSNDALVPNDVNGTQDVYEYEPADAGDCEAASVRFSPRSNGCVDLVSSGTSAEESAFLDASRTGADVFFLTAAKLVAQDFDSALDVYDAHECSAQVPCFAPVAVAPPPCSTGDGCKAAPTPQPSLFGEPASETFSGAGNVAPAPAVKAKAKAKAKPLTRAQKLASALRACKKQRRQRAACERKARHRYGATKRRSARSKKANTKQRGGA
jgi:hypothetical protein